MAAMNKAAAKYQQTDQLYLWWLAQPADPVYIGQLNTARTQRGVSDVDIDLLSEQIDRPFLKNQRQAHASA